MSGPYIPNQYGAPPDWSAILHYPTGTCVAHNGILYRAITPLTGNEPPSSEWTVVISGTGGTIPVPLQLGTGDGDPINWPYQLGQLLRVYNGTVADPIIIPGPEAQFAQISNVDARTQTGLCSNPFEQECFAAVHITSLNLPTAYNQAVGLYVDVYGDTDNGGVGDGNADLCAGFFYARKGQINGALQGRGLVSGLFTGASRWEPGNLAGGGNTLVGIEGNIDNRTDVDCHVGVQEGGCFAFHASCSTGDNTPGVTAGVAFNVFGGSSNGFRVGLLLQPSGVATAGYGLYDASVNPLAATLRIENTKVRGIDARAATFTANAISLGVNHRIAWNEDGAPAAPDVYLRGDSSVGLVQVNRTSGAVTFDVAGDLTVLSLQTTGAATGKKVVCVDTTTGKLYASSTGTDCTN